MNCSRNILLRSSVLPKSQRSLHAVSSTIDASSTKTSQGPHKQSQNNARPFVAAAMEQQMIHTQSPLIAQPSAKDIQLLLSNIGAGHRASLPTIESMMRKNKADDADMSTVTANEMIDLIAQIRSI
mmetsp:Transcript_8473/g.18978  ORF Transcript_8473/g.18978 Transcript_8473/m.18978 type:complete len:126 (+) Transcript_8473:177-554(+)|eukprot:CAMPEP_0172302426 /NCGR_PEP_ID=MMETSP1058-20130122/4126_1 /TAXON_ID=83371 /ORGANISM="Detonula confervacea, Strain CCMP 353" /LENGTH=125 /DNA_ID=CAMNT_0013012891 /DNA_START=115 /DNA_END=492 /DNA_ORIENTATION=+